MSVGQAGRAPSSAHPSKGKGIEPAVGPDIKPIGGRQQVLEVAQSRHRVVRATAR